MSINYTRLLILPFELDLIIKCSCDQKLYQYAFLTHTHALNATTFIDNVIHVCGHIEIMLFFTK